LKPPTRGKERTYQTRVGPVNRGVEQGRRIAKSLNDSSDELEGFAKLSSQVVGPGSDR